MKLPDRKQLREYELLDVVPPSHEEHGVTDTWEHPLKERLTRAKCTNWKLQGNTLTCDTDFGPLSQTIPTGYILTGEKNGLPVFRKVLS